MPVVTRGRQLPMQSGRTTHESEHVSNSRCQTFFSRHVNTRFAQTIFHSIFTSFQRHVVFPHAFFLKVEKVIDNNNILEIPGAPRNNHIVQRNLEVSLWTKSVKEKTEIGEYDDNIGEDSLSSQSIYAQDIASVKYL